MKKICLIFGGILAIAGNAYAVTSTVTSKDYVDTEVGKKQNTIPVSGTNSSTPGNTVITYTSTAGTIGERGIFNPETDLENGEIVSGHEGDLLTADTIVPAINDLYNDRGVHATTTNRVCTEWVENATHTDEHCLLWRLIDQPVYSYGTFCQTNADCSGVICLDGYPVCVSANNVCTCRQSGQ